MPPGEAAQGDERDREGQRLAVDGEALSGAPCGHRHCEDQQAIAAEDPRADSGEAVSGSVGRA